MRTHHTILAALLIAAIVSSAWADTVTLAPTDDMYTDPDHATVDTTMLWVGNFSGGCGTYRERIMFKFDLSGIEGTVDSATLNLYRWWRCPGDYYTSTDVYAITQNWNEHTWPFAQHIGHETTPSCAYNFGPHLGWYEVDVTDLVQSWVEDGTDNYGLVIIGRWGAKCSKFYSKEYANPNMSPSLDVTYTGTGVGDEDMATRQLTVTNYPNPFNPVTTIQYHLPTQTHATLRIYDTRGRLIRQLFDAPRSPGDHETVWDGNDDHGRSVPSGIYLSIVDTETGRTMSKMALIK